MDHKYYENNFFTARQMLHCLKVLYENQDRYPRLIESMQRAQPDNYFKRDERRFDIAHKYGYLIEGYRLYMNDCAICFTDDPILIVMFTDGCAKAYEIMAEYPTLMCDYTQYHTAIRREEERQEAARQAELSRQAAEEAARQAELSREAAEEAARQAEQIWEENPNATLDPGTTVTLRQEQGFFPRLRHSAEQNGLSRQALIADGCVILATLILCLALVTLGRKYRMRSRFAVLAAAILCVLALVLINLPALKHLQTRPN